MSERRLSIHCGGMPINPFIIPLRFIVSIISLIALFLVPNMSKAGSSWVFPLPTTRTYQTSTLNYYSGGGEHRSYINQYVLGIGSSARDIVADIVAPANTPIFAVADGTVITNKYGSGGGYYVVIKHDDDSYSYYGHMIKQSTIAKGTKVSAGQQIGKVGKTGTASGYHLHFEWSLHDPFCLFTANGYLEGLQLDAKEYPHTHAAKFTLPQGMVRIEEKTFYGDTAITAVTVPYGAESIGSKAFANSGLTDIYLPSTVTEIAEDAFDGTVVIHAPEGSYARKFANDNGMTWVSGENYLEPASSPITAEVGKYITFGHYPQTEAGTDSTPIEWLVLEKQGNQALVISKYGLDAKPYHTEPADVTWETCSLRTWLKGTFMDTAFTASEKAKIVTTAVENSQSQCYSGWSTSGGNNTQDKIFLLSYAEANKYFDVTWENDNNMTSRTSPTAYAKKNGAYTSSSDKTSEGAASGSWWLRSPGDRQSGAAYVYPDGSLYLSPVNDTLYCVRPAFWLNL